MEARGPWQAGAVELTLYGVDGSVIFERELCTPDTCVLDDNRNLSTCGEPPSSGLDIDSLPLGGCDEEKREVGRGAAGCSVTGRGRSTPPPAGWFFAAAGLAGLGLKLSRPRNR